MRIYALIVFVGVLAVYAWRNWYISLLGLLLLTTVLERRDMPKAIMGIPGLNAWNFLFISVVVAWLLHRTSEGLRWDFPRPFLYLCAAYFGLVVLAWLRAAIDLESFRGENAHSVASLAIDEVINPFKYIFPAILLFDGARSRQRVHWTIVCFMLAATAYAVLVIRVIPLGTLFGDGDFMRFRHRVDRDTGLNAVDMATLLVGTFWIFIIAMTVWRQLWIRLLLTGGACTVFLGAALCQSRGAFAALAGVALILGLTCWRKLLLIVPAAAIVICLVMPAIPQRLGMGLDDVNAAGGNTVDWETATAGRASSLWPPIIEQIQASPIIGHGRRTILRTQAYEQIMARDNVVPTHPHNAYLEMLADAGIAGLLIALSFYGYLIWQSFQLTRIRRDPLLRAIGAMGLAALGTLLIASLGAQSLFPKVSGMLMWATCGLVLRGAVIRMHQRVPHPRSVYATDRAPLHEPQALHHVR